MKKSYEVVTPLRNGGKKPIPVGETVELDAREGDALVALKALRPASGKPASKAAAPSSPPTAGDAKPLAKQSFDELKATAKAEKVKGYGLIKDETKLRAAIEAHRTAQAKA